MLSFYFLQKYQITKSPETFWLDSVRLTIRLAGDADVNATIVGGLVGALVGVHMLP
jgi:ADP-ribosylglycohydrolase